MPMEITNLEIDLVGQLGNLPKIAFSHELWVDSFLCSTWLKALITLIIDSSLHLSEAYTHEMLLFTCNSMGSVGWWNVQEWSADDCENPAWNTSTRED